MLRPYPRMLFQHMECLDQATMLEQLHHDRYLSSVSFPLPCFCEPKRPVSVQKKKRRFYGRLARVPRLRRALPRRIRSGGRLHEFATEQACSIVITFRSAIAEASRLVLFGRFSRTLIAFQHGRAADESK